MTLIKKVNVLNCILLLWMLFFAGAIKAQCTGCTTVITGGSSNFSVNVGQIVCIEPGVTYTGNITLNGGVLCNQGNLTRITFKKGTFNNYGVFADVNSLAINTNGNLLINCYAGSTFSIGTGMSLVSSNINDSVVIYNNTGALFNTGTSLTMHNTKFSLYNGDDGSGSSGGGGVGAFAIFNIGATFSITDSTEFKLRNYSSGYFNVSSNLSFNAAGNKSLVNKGIFNVNNAVAMSGTGNSTDLINIINQGQFNVTGNISTAINNTGVLIQNMAGGILSSGISLTLSRATNTLLNYGEIYVNQDLLVQNGIAQNDGFINVNRDFKVNTGRYTNNNYALVSRNLIAQNWGYVLNNSTIQPFGYLLVASTSTFVNTSAAQAVPNLSAVVQGTSTVINSGNFATPGIIRITTATFLNEASGNLSSGSNLQALTNASLVNTGTLIAGLNLQISNSNFQNTNYSNVIADFLPQGTTNAINDGTLNVGTNVRITTATLTNNHVLIALNNFSTTNSSAVFNNNNYLQVDNEFKNTSVTNLALNSVLKLNNYVNSSGSTAFINGPTAAIDTASYAKIIISGNSTNGSFINGQIVVDDHSLLGNSTNNGYGFDAITNPTRIATSIIFAAKASGPGNPVVINCNPFAGFYTVFADASLYNVPCGGAPVQLSAQLTLVTFTPGPFGPYYIPVNSPPVSYTWLPTNQNAQNITVSPNVTTTYTVIAKYGACTFTKVITINVTSPLNYIATINGAPDIIFPYPDGVTLNSNVTGGQPPYSYLWTPNIYFQPPGNTVQNPTVNPPVALTYVLTVTDVNGCVTYTTVNVIPAPYAYLNKIPDGGYYKLVNNRMLFKFDGQYATTGLTYKVFNKNNSLVTTSISSLIVNSGDNRYSLNASSLNAGEYYTLEVTNEKKEKLYLRFIR